MADSEMSKNLCTSGIYPFEDSNSISSTHFVSSTAPTASLGLHLPRTTHASSDSRKRKWKKTKPYPPKSQQKRMSSRYVASPGQGAYFVFICLVNRPFWRWLLLLFLCFWIFSKEVKPLLLKACESLLRATHLFEVITNLRDGSGFSSSSTSFKSHLLNSDEFGKLRDMKLLLNFILATSWLKVISLKLLLLYGMLVLLFLQLSQMQIIYIYI